MHAQPGIFALGTTEHCFLEFDLPDSSDDGVRAFVTAVADLSIAMTTVGGVNVVVGVRPSLWSRVAEAHHVPGGAEDFAADVDGPDGFSMPATQHDAWVWLAGGSRTVVFDAGRAACERLGAHADVAAEITGWVYRHDRDLTGFVDGTENPSLLEAPDVVAVAPGEPGAGSSVVLHQLWRHDTARWQARSTHEQELAMGRTKADSAELAEDDMPVDSHVSRTVVEVDGEELDIFRRNVAYGGVTDHGTVFVGFSHDQWRMAEMLRRMAGVGDGIRCALTRYTSPRSGAYYVVPSVQALADFAADDTDV